jgi:hypothetical protein
VALRFMRGKAVCEPTHPKTEAGADPDEENWAVQ